MKVYAVIILFFALAIFCGAQQINDITALNNDTEISVESVTEPQYFYYSTLGTNGIVRIYITNDGTVDIVAHLQQCYLPFQTYFTSGDDRDFIDTCTAAPGGKCELVVKACYFDPVSRYYIKVNSEPEDETFSHKIKVFEEDFSNALIMRDDAYYMNSLNTLYKYPYKTYRFEMPDSKDATVDIFVKHLGEEGKLNIFISSNKTGDLECSLLNITDFGPGAHHFRLTRECLKDYTESETFFLSFTAVNDGFYNIPFEARIYSQEKRSKYEKIDKEIAIREYLADPFRPSNFEVDLRKDKNNTITTFTLNHPYEGITSTSRLIVSEEEDPNDLCADSVFSCTFSGHNECEIELESCHREERQYLYISTIPIYSNLSQVPLTLGFAVKEHPIEHLENEVYYRSAPTEWSFFELDTHDFYSPKTVNFEIRPIDTELLEVHVTRGGITKGGSCSDEKFVCEGDSLCKGSFALCDFDYNGTSIYLSIRSLPPFSSKYTLNVTELEPRHISFNDAHETSISTYETHMYFVDDEDEELDVPGMAILEFIDSSTDLELILSVVAANESGCPVHSQCSVNSENNICSIPLICLGEDQQPYLKVTTNKADKGEVEYSLKISKLGEQSLTDGESVSFTSDDEKWFFIEEEYEVNIRYSVQITEGTALVNMYRDCVELDNKICEVDKECNLFANRNDKAYGGTYWLRIRPQDSSKTSGKVELSVGVNNCQNITTEFCGFMFADVIDIDIEENDLLAKESYGALALTTSSEICSSVKDYVCGMYFPICGEFGVAPAICKESCIEAFDECAISSTCPYRFCESLPDCPVPPEPSKFYSGYIALIIIYSLLVVGLIFTAIIIIIKKE